LRSTRRFAPHPESAAAARDFVTRAVRAIGCESSEAALLTSELATNAIVHAQTHFDVNVERRGEGTVRVAIVNHAPEMLPVFREPSAEGGRGLVLVDRLATAWGFERREDRKAMWFELSVDGGA
jgi:anti-sigma regulatory factor (Ser/Thr protein kinase)